jgi:hypothetical protein
MQHYEKFVGVDNAELYSQATSQWVCGNARLEECARDQLVTGPF